MYANEEMHADVWDKTSNFFHILGGQGGGRSDIKQFGLPFLSHMYLLEQSLY